MSGGSYEYFYFKLNDFADEVRDSNDPRRIAFKKLMKLCADAAHDIEWVDSGDYGKDGADKSLDKVFAFLGNDTDIITKAQAYDELKNRLQEFFK
jgi:hypothetical protein